MWRAGTIPSLPLITNVILYEPGETDDAFLQ
ncbi:hypothetical protein Dbac_0326 [Desulfomicrobium baculatum DSM 4028]|uniref:Uncharacterized protein n=1 Tax=Desulfomicrobium baculatum (strain DSM 4028 / VKM B-1378 / X) TaxID=525897 RepID=C7LVB1_DESBD|nr:hypothetical protein Dbac_0326 [Desulfomicrobium baculatum DSM 4028]